MGFYSSYNNIIEKIQALLQASVRTDLAAVADADIILGDVRDPWAHTQSRIVFIGDVREGSAPDLTFKKVAPQFDVPITIVTFEPPDNVRDTWRPTIALKITGDIVDELLSNKNLTVASIRHADNVEFLRFQAVGGQDVTRVLSLVRAWFRITTNYQPA